MNNVDNYPKNITNAIRKLADRYNFWAMYSFGSRAKEAYDAIIKNMPPERIHGSDLDIAIHYENGFYPAAREKVLLAQELEDLFNVPRIDLVSVGEAGPFLALDIIRGEILFCTDPPRQAEYELYVLRRAGDLAYFERERRNLLLNL